MLDFIQLIFLDFKIKNFTESKRDKIEIFTMLLVFPLF